MTARGWAAAAAMAVVAVVVVAVVLAGVAAGTEVRVSGSLSAVVLIFVGTVTVAVGTGVVLAARARRIRTDSWTRRQAEVAAATAAERQRLLLRLDHELKNPLTAIMVSLANLRTTLPTTDVPARGSLESATAQAARLSRIVADLRKLAELETRPLELAPIDLAELLREVVDTVADVPETTQRQMRLSIPGAPWPLPCVTGDRDLLFLAVLNLCLNAVKYSQPGDTVEIRAADDNDYIDVEVADTGVGVPPDEVDTVWEELARGRGARTVPGTGVGLALVRTVVIRHGGTVALRSREGHGTVVTLRLPVDPAVRPVG